MQINFQVCINNHYIIFSSFSLLWWITTSTRALLSKDWCIPLVRQRCNPSQNPWNLQKLSWNLKKIPRNQQEILLDDFTCYYARILQKNKLQEFENFSIVFYACKKCLKYLCSEANDIMIVINSFVLANKSFLFR